MSQPKTAEFPTASSRFKTFLENANVDFGRLRESSKEAYVTLKKEAIISWQNMPEIVEKYKLSIQNMPKEMRQRDSFKNILKEIEKFEFDFKKSQFKESLNQHMRDADQVLKAWQARIRELSCHVDEVEDQTVVQKYVNGETILSCKTKLQWMRKLTHAGNALFFCYFFAFSGIPTWIIWTITGVFLSLCFTLEIWRHLNPRVNEWVFKYFKPIMREHEKKSINSAMYYIVSMVAVYLIFPIEVTVLTILFLGLGDVVAGIVGVKWGKIPLKKNVSLEGFLACFGMCFLISFIFSGFVYESVSGFSLILFSFLTGLVGAFAESSFKNLDDNLVMPVISAPFIWIFLSIFS